jgi:pilus assembly protein CpaB
MRVFIVLLLAITAGSGLAFGTYNYMNKLPARTVSVPTQKVVVASSDLDIGTEIGPNDVKLIEWPTNAVPANVFNRKEDVVGRGLIVPVIQNEPILPLKLASKEAGAGLPPLIPPGMRALSVRVNEVIGVAGYVLPGTRVDVVVTVSPTDTRADMTSKVILTNVQVLAAGTKIERDVEHNKPIAVTVVTLLVDPDEAERLTLASTEGKIQLALRNPLDKTTTVTRGVRPSMLLGLSVPVRQGTSGRAAVQPAPRSYDVPTVEVIRGDKRAHEIVRQEP